MKTSISPVRSALLRACAPGRGLPLLMASAAMTLSTLAHADDTITILHSNDFHSRVEPISKYDSPCSAEDNEAGECFGGYARMVTAVAQARERHPDALLFDGGDRFQGSLFYTFYKGKVAAEIMNTLQYDGMTVGNHEFDDGPVVLREFIDNVDFPVVMSNADVSQEPALANKIMKSTVVEKAGQKYGIIGLTPQDTNELASPGKNITFSDPVAAVQAEVDELTAQGIKRIVVLSHSGYEVDKRVAAETTGVDVIVGGHSNTFLSNTSDKATGPYPTMVGDTAIVQAYAYGKYLGELAVTFNDDGEVVEATGEPITIDGSIDENEDILARVAELAEPLDSIRNKVVAAADAPIDGNRDVCRVQECEMGNLIADALLDRVKDQGVSIAIMNSGGVRASIDAGEITMGEVLTVLPFQNTLATFQLSGADVVAALENGVSQVEEVKGRFPQVAGLSFTWDPSVPANEGRIKEVMVEVEGEMQPIDPEALYGVVSNNYVRGGGDGYSVFAENAINAYDFGPNVEDVVSDYLAEHAPYKPGVQKRISKL
ncbi:bifunctional metallophosphatase/5'-nucleotidase [Granulosicoccus sp. 3-233]|uniref:bifunctional metallophosphatase/5'-nucleotidase n=1 Tax=Granulosicoccus sp. 3-233 TaxID=3417969 RepID=UPI003D339984